MCTVTSGCEYKFGQVGVACDAPAMGSERHRSCVKRGDEECPKTEGDLRAVMARWKLEESHVSKR